MRQFNTSRFGSPSPFKGSPGFYGPFGNLDAPEYQMGYGPKFGFDPKPPLQVASRPTATLVDNVIDERTKLADRLTTLILNDLSHIETDVLDEVDRDDHASLDSYSRELIKVAVHETLFTIEDRCEIRGKGMANDGTQVGVRLTKLCHKYWEHVNT